MRRFVKHDEKTKGVLNQGESLVDKPDYRVPFQKFEEYQKSRMEKRKKVLQVINLRDSCKKEIIVSRSQ